MRPFLLTTSLALTLFFLIAPAVFAEFVPLAPIPNLDTSDGATLSSYLNSVFNFAISIGAILAVLMIIKGGFEYMTTEAVGKKGEARTSIQNAVLGLILLLMIVLILEVINPQLLNLDLFRNLEQAPTEQESREIQSQLNEDQERVNRENNLQGVGRPGG